MIEIIKYAPFQSTAEPSFWMKLGDLKINKMKLSEAPIPVSGSYGIVSSVRRRPSATPPAIAGDDNLSVSTMSSSVTNNTIKKVTSGRMRFDQDSVEHDEILEEVQHEWSVLNNEKIPTRGKMILLNTIESFKTINKNKLLNEVCLPALMKACGIGSHKSDYRGEDEEESLDDGLTDFLCLAHLDLKSHKVIYWFAFPVLVPVPDKIVHYKTRGAGVFPPQRPLRDCWGEDMIPQLQEAIHELRLEILRKDKPRVGHPSFFIVLLPTEKSKLQCVELSRHNYMSLTDKQRRDCCFAFLDPTTSHSTGTIEPVGWFLRNLIAYLVHKLSLAGTDVNIISYRPDVIRKIQSISDPWSSNYLVEDSSLMLEVHLPSTFDYLWPSDGESSYHNCMGWELNARAKSGPRSINLAPLMSPQHLAQQAMDLNLKLMKWRMIPNLDLNLLSQTRVLLLGAGTLGCSVARCLLGWGVRNITFVDNGKVSFSNPVRQNLFELDDCENGGAFKSVAAASALSRIAGQTVQSEGVVLSIPMPGHAFSAKEESTVRDDVIKLQELVDSSDVVFLLTDTRESRWLPTVMARSSGKLMINAALGLDSWLVMRHGGYKDTGRLGCYFCNDVVAPENSTNNRTLDQQCTVTRPGLAPIAASMAVELMVALLHHKEEQNAPAPAPTSTTSGYKPDVNSSSESTCPLGIMPHQIRGSIVSYTMMTPTVPAFPHCTGCCESIVQAYDDQGFDFVKQSCCNDGKFLEDVAGLTQFREAAAAKMEDCLDWEEDEEGSDQSY